MNKKSIQVRNYIEGQWHSRHQAVQLVETVTRKLYCDTLGNFNRIACRYAGKTYCVKSDAGDIGDPFRANEEMLDSLWIDINKPCAWNL